VKCIDIASYLQEKCFEVEQRLEFLLPEKNTPYNHLFPAARYSVLGGGKRLRPLLTLAAAEAFGESSFKALNAACAIEMVHTYSLIHDDLPCMDDDDYRRGKLTLHKAFDEAHAVLAGDFLLTYAFEIIAEDSSLRPDQKIALIHLLAKNSGDKGMIAGQVMDIESEGRTIDINTLNTIHHLKTGAMISAAVEFGGIIADASPDKLLILRHFGADIGLAFQIVDDILDVSASIEKHGRITPSDESNHKTTYVTLLGLEAAEQKAQALLEQAQEHLSRLEVDSSILEAIAQRLVCRYK